MAEFRSASTIIGTNRETSNDKECKGKVFKQRGSDPVITWNQKVPDTGLEQFQKMIENKYNVKFESYWELHKWSVQNYTKYWEEVWHYCEVITSKPYEEVLVKTGPGFMDNDWFRGAEFNFAENVLRIKDDRKALICLDESGAEEIITFAQIFEEVKLYAAAFRKNGLQKNDTVACYMSNRKEAIFAMLAVTSIGAIWGGPLAFYGGRAASTIVNMMEPKFLITIDTHTFGGEVFPLLSYLPLIVDDTPSIEKVILLVKDEETYKKDLSSIRNCVFLEDFLQDGRNPDGKVPDIVFEQVPFNHPISIIFTSGTTGLPKGIMHSGGTYISKMINYMLHLNLKCGDVVCTLSPVGWNLWDFFVPMLGLGVHILLYCGSSLFTIKGKNFWDILAKHNVNFTFMVTTNVDRMEKMQMVPSPSSNLDSLKIIGIGGCPIKKENYEYLQTMVKKDVFVGSRYGATEVMGSFSGFCLNIPVYAGEIQVPSMGMDLQCYDEQGNSVIGQRGELVVCTPAVNFPIRLWKDDNNVKLNSTYFSKYPGVWCQNDECWINPKTKGIVIVGRSDDTLKQYGNRFGAGDIYCAINSMEELQDYICVSQQKYNGESRAILFVKLKKGYLFTPEFRRKIEINVTEELWVKCVPEVIVEVPDIPYNVNNKRMESVVRKIVETNKIPDVMNIKNPESLKYFVDIPEIVSYN